MTRHLGPTPQTLIKGALREMYLGRWQPKPLETEYKVYSNLALQNLDLSRTRFIGCRFDLSSLDQSDLIGSELTNCTFRGASLIGVDLTNTRISDCDFDHANLSNAKLNNGYFVRCTFEKSVMPATLATTRFQDCFPTELNNYPQQTKRNPGSSASIVVQALQRAHWDFLHATMRFEDIITQLYEEEETLTAEARTDLQAKATAAEREVDRYGLALSNALKTALSTHGDNTDVQRIASNIRANLAANAGPDTAKSNPFFVSPKGSALKVSEPDFEARKFPRHFEREVEIEAFDPSALPAGFSIKQNGVKYCIFYKGQDTGLYAMEPRKAAEIIHRKKAMFQR